MTNFSMSAARRRVPDRGALGSRVKSLTAIPPLKFALAAREPAWFAGNFAHHTDRDLRVRDAAVEPAGWSLDRSAARARVRARA
jgi:hypothetical protein